MRIQRSADNDGRTDVFPLFPDVRLAETNSINTIAFDDADQRDYARVAAEPNTVVSEVAVGAQIISSTTYVLENYSTAGAGFFDFDLAFSIRFDNYFIDGQPRQFTIAIPKYNPTTELYPDLDLDLPISGHMASAYGGPVNSAEGILIQVFELAPDANGNPQPMQFYFSWFTFNGDHQTFPARWQRSDSTRRAPRHVAGHLLLGWNLRQSARRDGHRASVGHSQLSFSELQYDDRQLFRQCRVAGQCSERQRHAHIYPHCQWQWSSLRVVLSCAFVPIRCGAIRSRNRRRGRSPSRSRTAPR